MERQQRKIAATAAVRHDTPAGEVVQIDSLVSAEFRLYNGATWLYLEVAAVGPLPPANVFSKTMSVRYRGPEGIDATTPVEAIPFVKPDSHDQDIVRLLLRMNVEDIYQGFDHETTVTVRASPNSPSFTDTLFRLQTRRP
jgi:hypothetical protein